jgi:hypothetical protein
MMTRSRRKSTRGGTSGGTTDTRGGTSGGTTDTRGGTRGGTTDTRGGTSGGKKDPSGGKKDPSGGTRDTQNTKESLCRLIFSTIWLDVFRIPFARYGSFKRYCIAIGAYHSRIYPARKFTLDYIYASHRSYIYGSNQFRQHQVRNNQMERA